MKESEEGSLLESVDRMAPVIREHAAQAEREGRLPKPVVDAMKKAGLFRLWVPKAFGGLEVDPLTSFRIFEEVSRVDSAAGWNLMIVSGVLTLMPWITDEGVGEIFKDPDAIVAGTLNPPGRAVAIDGGYRVTGRMPFVSACHHATWFLGPAHVFDGDTPRLDESGQPVTIVITYPASDAEIIDNWNVLGMRGTGSHDVAIDDVFVPARQTGPLEPLESLRPAFDQPLFRLTIWHAVGAISTVALGIARAAIDDLIDLAAKKTPAFTPSPLRDRAAAQSQLARAEALWGSARAYLYETYQKAWESALEGHMITEEQKVKAQLASSQAVAACVEATELVHAAAGTSGIRQERPFERHSRDAHTISQHAFTSANRFESMGQVLFGLPSNWPFFVL